jgi:hypothetical protein
MMADHEAAYTCYDDCCDGCVTKFYELTDALVKDIQHLEAKVVFLRYSLSKFLPAYDGEMLRCDIFSDLSGCYWDNAAYQQYMANYYDGHDPMDSRKHAKFMIRLSCGRESVAL